MNKFEKEEIFPIGEKEIHELGGVTGGFCDDIASEEVHLCLFKNLMFPTSKKKIAKYCRGDYKLVQIP